jgi:phosphoribosylformimino-5-aminoimidazole carboxamide ribotide isomerase
VRLLRGDFAAETVYDADPVAVARDFAAQGAPWIHVVDLDAARTGDPANLHAIEAICAAVECPVQSGGGVRSVEAAGRLLGAGVARVVVGTAAVEHPELVDELTTLHPGHVAVGLDARGREVAVRGWAEGSGHDLVDLVRRFDDAGVSAVIVTEIGRDGTLEGPDLDQLAAVLAATSRPVIASGGVGTLDHLADGILDGQADAVLAASIFHFGEHTVAEAKAQMTARGIIVRPVKGSSGPDPAR